MGCVAMQYETTIGEGRMAWEIAQKNDFFVTELLRMRSPLRSELEDSYPHMLSALD